MEEIVFNVTNCLCSQFLLKFQERGLFIHDTKVEAAEWSDWFYMSYIFDLELIHFCSTSFDGF